MTKPFISVEDQAMQYALRVLGYRARSEQEMRQRLARKGFAVEVADRTLAELARLGLLDDRDFAQSWITARTGRGAARLKQELHQKGIDRGLAEEVIHANISAEDEWAAARQTAQRALRSHMAPPTREDLARLRRLLQRRGFSFAIINRVCAGLSGGLTDEGEWLD